MKTRIPRFRGCIDQNFPFIENTFKELNDYKLLCRVVAFLQEIGEATEHYTEVVENLQNYVNNYFANLDVQDEINNKLEAMVESGDLQEIISEYLNSRAIFGFDTVADMKAASNLINGSYARTLGFYAKNDGGGALYKIRTVTNNDSVNEMDLIAITAGNDLIAELIIDDCTNIQHFGARTNRGNNITPYWNRMVSVVGRVKIPKGRFLISTPIVINTSYTVECDGALYYDGSEYAFEVKNFQTSHFKIQRFDSDNGGLFDMSPTSAISLSTFEIALAYCKKEVFYMNANNGIITLLKLRGRVWQSSTTSPIVMYQDTNTISSSYLSQIDIFDVDIRAGNSLPAITATCSHATKSLNFNLTNCDLENSKGITTTDRVFSIGMYNCRMGEINFKQGWLTFNNYMPIVTIIGTGDLDPSYITMNNLPDYGLVKSIYTNMNIVDHVTGSTYAGGGFITSRYVKPFATIYTWKAITSDISDGAVTLPAPNISGNLYKYFTFATSNDLTITVPDTYRDDFYIETGSAVNITITRGNKTCTIPSTESNTGLIEVKNIPGYSLKYTIFKD